MVVIPRIVLVGFPVVYSSEGRVRSAVKVAVDEVKGDVKLALEAEEIGCKLDPQDLRWMLESCL
jgi:hypothetical protein